MEQVLHIFRKDVRHHWLQIVVSVLVLVGYVWNEVYQWRGYWEATVWMRWVAPAAVILLPLGWVSLIVRSIQDERLVGDRQFWITRPFEWPQLLAGKALFVLTFVHLPLLIAQLVLLRMAGFAPLRYLPGLLWMQVLTFVVIILPVSALASVTSNLGQIVLGVILTGIYLILIAYLNSLVPSSSMPTGGLDDVLTSVILVAALAAVIFWQYSARRTARSRWTLVGCAAIVGVIPIAWPYTRLVNREFPLDTGKQVVNFSLDSSKKTGSRRPEERDEVLLGLPLQVSGIENDVVVTIVGQRIVLEAPGFRWSSGWQTSYYHLMKDINREMEAGFNMRREMFDRIQSTPVTVHIFYALSLERPKQHFGVVASKRDFAVPQVGVCRFDSGYNGQGLRCRAPLQYPSIVVRMQNSASTCDFPPNQRPQGDAFTWVGNTESGLGFDPVQSFRIMMGNAVFQENRPPRVCPGTSMDVAIMENVRDLQQELTIEGVMLENYRKDRFGEFTFGVGLR